MPPKTPPKKQPCMFCQDGPGPIVCLGCGRQELGPPPPAPPAIDPPAKAKAKKG